MNKLRPIQHGVLILMRVTLVNILITSFTVVMAYAVDSKAQEILNRKVTINVQEAEVQQVLALLGKQAKVKFTYNPQQIPVHNKVSFHFTDVKLADALNSILSAGIDYKVIGNQIALRPAEELSQAEGTGTHEAVAAVTVSGKVSDSNGTPLPGVSIQVKGTNAGTSTDGDGKYTIVVPDENAVLMFSFIGFAAQEVVVGTQTNIDIVLVEDINQLGEIVVTAFGIEREKKKLGYSVTEVNGDAIQTTREPAFMNALTGKIAGVVVQTPNAGPGGATRVLIRGNATFGGNRQPLYVIDGVPMDNTYRSSDGDPRSANSGNSAGTQTSDGLSNLNPDDVESISVLKGVAAGALYGNRAQNGVILITTKRGAKGQGLGISYNSNTVIEQAVPYTQKDMQYTYGRGEYGELFPAIGGSTYKNPMSWGPKFGTESTFIDFDGETRPYVAQKMKDNFKRFFDTGVSTTNSLAFSGSTEKSTYRLSMSHTYSKSPMPGVNFKRYNVSFRGTSDIGTKLHADYKIDVSRTDKHQPLVGTDDRGSYGIVFSRMSNTTDIRTLDKKDANGGYIYQYKNPYLNIEKVVGSDTRDRVIGVINLKYDITENLYASVVGGVDISNAKRLLAIRPNNFWDQNGKMDTNDQKIEEDNAMATLNFSKNYGDFSVTAFGGVSARYYNYSSINLSGNTFITPDLIDFSNMVNKSIGVPGAQRKKVNSIFASGQVGYKDYLFLELTAREDWNSALAKVNSSASTNNLFYPSANLSYVFSDHLSIAPNIISTGKVRASIGKVGSDQDPHQADLQFNGINSVNGVPAAVIFNGSLPPATLKPESTTELELGTQLGFFENRVNVDFAWYNKETKNFLLSSNVSAANGFSSVYLNAGSMRNRGIELLISGTPYKNNGLTWDVSLNIAHNKNKVLTLTDQLKETGVSFGNNIYAMEGLPFGSIIGRAYEKDAQGRDVYVEVDNGEGGQAVVRKRTESTTNYLGSANPDYTAGLTNTFQYKGFNFSFLIDGQFGGHIYSNTNRFAKFFGLTKETLVGRDGTYIPNGVMEDGTAVTLPFSAYRQYYGTDGNIGYGADQDNVYKNTFIKLRQVSLGYTLPSSMLGNKVKSVTLQLIARNLFYFKKDVPMIDPNSGDSIGGGYGYESGALPASRTYGFNLNVQF